MFFSFAIFHGPARSFRSEVWMCAYAVLLAWANTVFWWWRLRRIFDALVEKLKADDWCACLWCGYPLRGLPSPHHCPECGTPYELEETQHAWKHWARTGRLPEGISQPTPESPSRADVAS